jgi:hypothetical protein
MSQDFATPEASVTRLTRFPQIYEPWKREKLGDISRQILLPNLEATDFAKDIHSPPPGEFYCVNSGRMFEI